MKKKSITALTCALITISTSALPAFAAMNRGDRSVKAYDPKTGEVSLYNSYDFTRKGDTFEAYCARNGYIYIDTSAAETVEEIYKIEAEFKDAHPDAHTADLGFNYEAVGIKRTGFGSWEHVPEALRPSSAASTVQTMSDGTKFDPTYYAASNPDVVAAFGTDTSALYNHYVKCGKAEGRLPYAK